MTAFDISTPHSTYRELSPWWMEGLDFYRSGIHVLQPGREVGSVYFAHSAVPAASDGTSTEAAAATSAVEYLAKRKRSYLWSHERESENRFNDRQRRLGHFPIFQPVCDIHADAIMRHGLKIGATTPAWRDIVSDADRRHTSLDQVARDALSWALATSRVHGVVAMDQPHVRPVSRAAERDMGIRPYIRLVTPLDVINWALDANGDLIWGVVREREPEYREPGQPDAGREWWYRLWTRDSWYLYGRPRSGTSRGKVTIVAEGVHGLGFVPIATLWTDRDPEHDYYTQSPFATVQRIDRVVLNLLSLLHEIDYGQTFTTWFFPDAEAEGIGSLEFGTHNAVTGPMKPEPLSPDEKMAAGLMARIQSHIHLARMAAGVDRGQADKSIEARSGVAYANETEQKRHQMVRLAEATEDFISQSLGMMAAWMGMSRADAPTVSLPRNYDLKSLGQKINEALSLDSLGIGGKAMLPIKRSVVQAKMREDGADQKEIRIALKSIDETSTATVVKPAPMDPSEGAAVRDGNDPT